MLFQKILQHLQILLKTINMMDVNIKIQELVPAKTKLQKVSFIF